MQLSSLNDKRHNIIISINDKRQITRNATGFALQKNDKRHNVWSYDVVFLFCTCTYKLWFYLSLWRHFLVLNIVRYTLHVIGKYIHRQYLENKYVL